MLLGVIAMLTTAHAIHVQALVNLWQVFDEIARAVRFLTRRAFERASGALFATYTFVTILGSLAVWHVFVRQVSSFKVEHIA